MKLLKINNKQGYFLAENGEYHTVDQMDKDGLFYLVNLALGSDVECDLDEYDETSIPNQAHQIIYKSVSDKLSHLIKRRDEFLDQSERLYLEEYERYSTESPQQCTKPDTDGDG